MKHYFIINPAAGKGVESSQVIESIKDACAAADAEYEIYLTTARGDAITFVRNKISEKPSSETWRFYACGGDGTLSEVVNGAINTDAKHTPGVITGVEVGCIPIGTGNDFVKSIHLPKDPVEALKLQLDSPISRIDVGSMNDCRFLNVSGTGFDVDVLRHVEKYKEIGYNEYCIQNTEVKVWIILH